MKLPRRLVPLLALCLTACAGGAAGPVDAPPSVARGLPAAEGWLHLGPQAPARAEVLVPGRLAEAAALRLIEGAGRPARIEARCDGPARFRAEPDPPQPAAPRPAPAWAPAGALVMADLNAGSRGDLALDLGPGTGACDLAVRRGRAPAQDYTLRREAGARPRLAAIDAGAPRCVRPAAVPGGDRLAAAFAATRELEQTCPMPVGPTRLLPDALAGFDAKVEALTGRGLGAAALRSGDPDLPLDFSAAPDLDLIVLSYLNINADFTGALMARMLEWHAARGTVVRILVADQFWGEAERALFEGLAARQPTVQIRRFRYQPLPQDGAEGHLARIHRVQHVKLFATVGRDPARSRALIGGRNLGDGYVFSDPFDLSDHPELRQYSRDRGIYFGGFHSYRDLEMEFLGDAQVRALVGHWAELWHGDPVTARPRTPSAPPVRAADGGARLRHFLSVPWLDGGAQEDLFADLIAAAETRIDIASPYLNPPPRLAAALDAAIRRGVAVRVVTTERVREPGDMFITGLNRLFGAEWAGRIDYLDHDPHPMLLHTKAMVIDGRLTVLGSTNLNLRSFVHDLENGVMVLDPGLAARITALIDGYAADARPIAADAPVALLVRAMLRLPLVRRVF
jgi:phosphatidylserine/phosphatidylglycerophosphate/cardiolipin synthase-like enzyme